MGGYFTSISRRRGHSSPRNTRVCSSHTSIPWAGSNTSPQIVPANRPREILVKYFHASDHSVRESRGREILIKYPPMELGCNPTHTFLSALNPQRQLKAVISIAVVLGLAWVIAPLINIPSAGSTAAKVLNWMFIIICGSQVKVLNWMFIIICGSQVKERKEDNGKLKNLSKSGSRPGMDWQGAGASG